MSETGQELQDNNEQIIYFLNLLKIQRQEINFLISKQEDEKGRLEMEIERIYYKLTLICKSLATRKKARVYYDQTIKELEEHYKKIVESSGVLLNSVKMGAGQLEEIMDKKIGTGSLEGGERIPVKVEIPKPPPMKESPKPKPKEPPQEQMVAEKLAASEPEPIPEPMSAEKPSSESSGKFEESSSTKKSIATEFSRSDPSNILIDEIIPDSQNQILVLATSEPTKEKVDQKELGKKMKKESKHKHKSHKKEIPKKVSQDSSTSEQSEHVMEKSVMPPKTSGKPAGSSTSEDTSSKTDKMVVARPGETSEESTFSKLSVGALDDDVFLVVERFAQESGDDDTLYDDPEKAEYPPQSLGSAHFSSESSISLNENLRIKKSPSNKPRDAPVPGRGRIMSRDLLVKVGPSKAADDNVVVLKAGRKGESDSSLDTEKTPEDKTPHSDSGYNSQKEKQADDEVEIFKQGYHAQHKKVSSTPAIFKRKN